MFFNSYDVKGDKSPPVHAVGCDIKNHVIVYYNWIWLEVLYTESAVLLPHQSHRTFKIYHGVRPVYNMYSVPWKIPSWFHGTCTGVHTYICMYSVCMVFVCIRAYIYRYNLNLPNVTVATSSGSGRLQIALNLDLRDGAEETAMGLALWTGQFDVARELLEAGNPL